MDTNGTGIESIGFYVPNTYINLHELATERGVAPSKYLHGIGQELMAVPAPDEDIVTMAAAAAERALEGVDREKIETVIVATESGIDQSKAASIYVHRLLDLPSNCRTFEVKQACCSSTTALQMALASCAVNPDQKVLVIATDVARYGLKSVGEPTQGAGAIAMVVSAHPRILRIDQRYGSFTEDVMDFWRPNYRDEALVDGKFSIKIYLRALQACWEDFSIKTGKHFDDFDHFCYHLPFTKMAAKAHLHLAKHCKTSFDKEALERQVSDSLIYNRIVGNCYTASLYIGLLSLLENSSADLSHRKLGLFSYGSGCMATFFFGEIQAGYRDALPTPSHHEILPQRTCLPIGEYEHWYRHQLPQDGSGYETPRLSQNRFRLAGVANHQRLYERT